MVDFQKSVEFSRQVPIKYDVDVFVAGGGPAGICAAVFAARNGCSVYLAEGQSCFGGMGTSGLIPVFMQFTDGINFLAGKTGLDIYNRMIQYGAFGFENCLSIRAEVLKRVYDDILTDSGVSFSLMTQLIGVEKEDDVTVNAAIISAKSGVFAVKAKIYIDCTGDGDLCAWAGAPFDKGNENGNLMAGTLCSLWADIHWEYAEKGYQNRHLDQAYKDKVFKVDDRHLPGMFQIGHHTGCGNLGHAFSLDGTDEVSLTKALVEQRKLLLEYEKYYKNYLKGYEDMELIATAALMGVRETRRIRGDYNLCLEDFLDRAVFDDEIGRYCYAVDIHASSPDLKDYLQYFDEYTNLRYKDGESYGIPYRSLIPQKLDNVLMAGRCISCDRYIQSSIRVMPGCFITGQGAGAAASIAVQTKTNTRRVDIGLLKSILTCIPP